MSKEPPESKDSQEISEPSARKGNQPAVWEKFLNLLDERLQFGLLERLRRVKSYHIEGSILYIEPSSEIDTAYLKKSAVFIQLGILAKDGCGTEKVEIK